MKGSGVLLYGLVAGCVTAWVMLLWNHRIGRQNRKDGP